jgi:hypothetical protein
VYFTWPAAVAAPIPRANSKKNADFKIPNALSFLLLVLLKCGGNFAGVRSSLP